jgi:acetoin utilization deacetylase AcuC-like enzyme
VFYDERMTFPSNSYSPSTMKPMHAMADWRSNDLAIWQHPVVPATVEELVLAHHESYVRDVLAGRRENGFGERSPHQARCMQWTVGSMLSAARHVLEQKAPVACSPSSGFHHAHHRRARGFCTFNGLMVTAMQMILEQRAFSVAILDCDYHYADGTEDILASVGDSWAKRIPHYTAGADYHEERQASAFMFNLPSVVRTLCKQADLLLYQAGADQHEADPLGGLLSTKQMAERDRIVFQVAHDMGVPVVWNLAGGYQRDSTGGIAPVLALHRQTMQRCIGTYIKEQETQ